MLRITILLVFLFSFNCIKAQKQSDTSLLAEKEAGYSNSKDEIRGHSGKKYRFTIYSVNENPKGEVESHYMGKEIAEKWTLVNELYLRKSDVHIGFGSTYSETIKPSILNAVYRMNAHYKKVLNRKIISESEAKRQFSWILDCAIAICYCPESAEFESALTKTRDPDQIIEIFNAVELEKNGSIIKKSE